MWFLWSLNFIYSWSSSCSPPSVGSSSSNLYGFGFVFGFLFLRSLLCSSSSISKISSASFRYFSSASFQFSDSNIFSISSFPFSSSLTFLLYICSIILSISSIVDGGSRFNSISPLTTSYFNSTLAFGWEGVVLIFSSSVAGFSTLFFCSFCFCFFLCLLPTTTFCLIKFLFFINNYIGYYQY